MISKFDYRPQNVWKLVLHRAQFVSDFALIFQIQEGKTVQVSPITGYDSLLEFLGLDLTHPKRYFKREELPKSL